MDIFIRGTGSFSFFDCIQIFDIQIHDARIPPLSNITMNRKEKG